jgi:hypothetical protein
MLFVTPTPHTARDAGGISAQIAMARNFNAPMRMTIIGTLA